jgi:hypothetical protein
MTVSADLKADLAAVFERYAAQTGDIQLGEVAEILRKQKPGRRRGRPTKDDMARLEEMRVFIDAGSAPETAARFVAIAMGAGQVGSGESLEAATRRFARKFREHHPRT